MKLRDLFGTVWLPLYLLVGVSWLFAPSVAHEHYSMLKLISNEEAVRGAGVWFRLCDVAAAGLLLTAAWGFRVGRHARWFGKGVMLVAVLAVIDGVFPDTCYIGHATCSLLAAGSSAVHDIETVVLTLVVAVLSIVDAVRSRRGASIGFVALQLLAAFLVVTGLASEQMRVVLQYAYEVALIFWLGWLVDRYNPVLPTLGHERRVRRVLGFWVVAGGIFAIVTAIPHVRFLEASIGRAHLPYGLLLEQHGIIVGVLMLYVARHLLRGERPALWLAVVLFYMQILKYAVLTPQPIGLIVNMVLFLLLIYTRHSFDRNTEPPSWVSRLEDIAVVSGGIAIAIVVALGIVTISGNQARFIHDSTGVFGRPLHAIDKREESLSEQREARLQTLGETLVISLGVIAVWSLFRPKALHSRPEYHLARNQFEQLLSQYANSSEDYFKLWPHDKSYFCPPGLAGAIAYRVEGGVAFMLADPVAPSDREREQLLRAFRQFCRSHGWLLCALLISHRSPEPYKEVGLSTRQIGSSAIIDVATFNNETAKGKWWRWQRNRAAKQGWTYEKLLPPHDKPTLQGLRAISDAWLLEGDKTEQGFALGYFSEAYLGQCTVHVLRDATGRIIAFANELPAYGKVKQASVDLIRYLTDAHGAMPALLLYVIAGLNTSRFSSFDLGFVPLAKLDSDLARLVKRIGRSRFSAAGLEQFKNKFDPLWQPDYIAYDGDLIDLAKIAASLERVLRVESENEVQ